MIRTDLYTILFLLLFLESNPWSPQHTDHPMTFSTSRENYDEWSDPYWFFHNTLDSFPNNLTTMWIAAHHVGIFEVSPVCNDNSWPFEGLVGAVRRWVGEIFGWEFERFWWRRCSNWHLFSDSSKFRFEEQENPPSFLLFNSLSFSGSYLLEKTIPPAK